MITCSKCGREESRGVIVFDAQGRPCAEYCLFCRPRKFCEPDRAKDVFADGFQLQHVRGLDGKPITVHSVKELRQVEKTHNVALAIMSDDKVGGPPQHEEGAGQLHRGYKKKFCLDERAYGPDKVAEAMKGVGCLQSAEDSLARLPNPLNR